jgi:hypothetical protein
MGANCLQKLLPAARPFICIRGAVKWAGPTACGAGGGSPTPECRRRRGARGVVAAVDSRRTIGPRHAERENPGVLHRRVVQAELDPETAR